MKLDSLTANELFQSTCFPRRAIHDLINLLCDDLKRQADRSHAILVETQVLAALQLYSSGSFQWMVGQSTGLSQASISRVVNVVMESSVVLLM